MKGRVKNMRMEIVVDTSEDFNLIDDWLYKQSYPCTIAIDVYVMSEANTYCYSTQEIDGQWVLAAGEGK